MPKDERIPQLCVNETRIMKLVLLYLVIFIETETPEKTMFLKKGPNFPKKCS